MQLVLLNNIPFVWLGIAILFIIIEALSINLATIWFALGALISMVLAFLDIPLAWQILIFLVISSVLLAFTRPVLVRKLKLGSVKTNADSLIGQTGLVTHKITNDKKGQVRVKGQTWTAASSNAKNIPANSRVIIDNIEGVTLYVHKNLEGEK